MGYDGRSSYKDVRKLEHTGKIQHRNRGKGGNNIVVHVLSGLDDSGRYKEIDGVLHVQDVNFSNGDHHGSEGYIPINEHNAKHYPRIQNPLNDVDKSQLKSLQDIL